MKPSVGVLSTRHYIAVGHGAFVVDRIIDAGEFNEAVAVNFVQQMLAGLSYLHLQGIAHRDLKPENYLIANNKTAPLDAMHLKLIDFGMSRRFASKDSKPEKMQSWVASRYYAAPEILAGGPYLCFF